MTRDRAYIGLGSNLGDRLMTLRSAVRHLAGAGAIAASSAIYETRPIGPALHPFLNAAVELRGAFEPEALLAALLEIEALHDRRRELRWGPRTLDLDLLAIVRDGACLRWSSERLTLPHPRVGDRDFVLAPLAELAPTLRLVDGVRVRDRLDALPAAARTIFERSTQALC
ncbi:MAG: 2-amino-4-hydroxy-6-hydroxymethyldihydropteridine diphosphokinase [Nannocystaceae bacterium]